MPACKCGGKMRFSLSVKKLCVKALCMGLVFGLYAGLFALDFPTVDSPSMPSISGSSSGPSTPWRGSAPYVPNQQSQSQTESSQTNSTDQELSDTVAGLALTAQSISGLGGLEALESLGGLGELTGLSGISSLTGLDTKSLEAALEKLQDSSKTSQTTDASATADSGKTASSETLSSETVATLQQILQKLELLAEAQAASKKEAPQGAGQTAASTSSTANTGTASAGLSGTTNLSPSRILRFRANATDLLPSCKTVYFSQPDPAGIFLLTGDRVVKAGGKDRNETFYFLFTPTLDAEGKFLYKVEAELTQDWAADRSELYPLTTSLPLTATRTGNLVTLRHNSEDWNLDLLLDLREAE